MVVVKDVVVVETVDVFQGVIRGPNLHRAYKAICGVERNQLTSSTVVSKKQRKS